MEGGAVGRSRIFEVRRSAPMTNAMKPCTLGWNSAVVQSNGFWVCQPQEPGEPA